MKRLIYILFIFIAASCCNDEYLGPNYKNSEYQYAYIYESKTIGYDSCQMIGFINNQSVNRRCYITDGYINIGTTNIYNDSVYFVDVYVYLNNKYMIIKEYKNIYTNLNF